MLFQQVSQFPYQLATLGGRQARPGTAVERLARRFHGGVNVLPIAFRDLRQNFAGGWVVGWESLARGGIHPLAVDQHFARLCAEVADPRINLDRRNCNAHISSLEQDRVREVRCAEMNLKNTSPAGRGRQLPVVSLPVVSRW